MKTIALTGSNDIAVAKVAQLLIDASRTGGFPLQVHVGVDDAHQAATITASAPNSEIWRVGFDSTRPELDPLVDRMITDAGPFADTAADTARALRAFMHKTEGAAA
jgi:hypothetical protein